MKNKMIVNFKNVVSEMENKGFKLCFLRDRGLFIEDSQRNLFQMELCRCGSYLDKLIKDAITVEFNLIDISINKNIGNLEKEIWDVSEVKNFIKRQRLLVE